MSREPIRSILSLTWEIDGRRVEAAMAAGIDCARPLRFDTGAPVPFSAPPARRRALDLATGPADVRRGGAVNADRLDLVPHAHGTHTESFGHLSEGRETLVDVFEPRLLPASVITVEASSDVRAEEEAGPSWAVGDLVVTRSALLGGLASCDPSFVEGLAVRIVPVGPPDAPTYLTGAAASLVRDRGILHLVLELPSIDRPEDGGRLAAHRAFWGMDADSRSARPDRRGCTLTEMAVFPPSLRDGSYLLDLQVPPIDSDAAPSRPVFYPVSTARTSGRPDPP